MINERPFNYFKNGLAIGVGVGFAGGIFDIMDEEKTIDECR